MAGGTFCAAKEKNEVNEKEAHRVRISDMCVHMCLCIAQMYVCMQVHCVCACIRAQMCVCACVFSCV